MHLLKNTLTSFFFFLFIVLNFSGCEQLDTILNTKNNVTYIKTKEEFDNEVALSKEIQLKKLELETQKELALIASKKELAEIEKVKILEKIKLDSEIKKQQIAFEQENAKRAFEYKLQEAKRSDQMEIKRYYIFILFLIIVLFSASLFYYFTKKREDKLKAYNDNLEKYFHQKENETKLKIAEKVLDTISSGALDQEQKNQLIQVLHGDRVQKQQIESNETTINQIENISSQKNENSIDNTIIEIKDYQ